MLWLCVPCRFPRLSTISIKLDEGSKDCELDPVLAQLHTHATGLHSLSLELQTGWARNPLAGASLGQLVSLTKLQLTFGDEVRVRSRWADA